MSMAARRRPLRRFLVAALVVAAILLSLPIALTPGLRARLTAALGERFGSDVELASLRVSVLPRLRVTSGGVVLRHKGRTDVPPLITIASFSAEANLWGLIGKPLRLKRIRVEGLEINIPPGGIDGDDDDDEARSAPPPQPAPPAPSTATGRRDSPLLIDDLLAERAVLRILRRDPQKEPRVWEIAQLSMQGTGSNEPWPFRARLTNPIPPGQLAVEGTFGPWNADQPSRTPLGAAYEFHEADLAMFKGIHGVLQSTGRFNGILKRIEVEGTTSVPAFALDKVGQPVPVTTRFAAVVDGTNGNVWLRPVTAQLGQSSLVAEGGIVEPEGQDGRTISLDVVMTEARVEDVLRLAVKSATPALVGALKLKTKLLFPPGDADAIEKLQLDGSFEIDSARFSAGGLQAKMNELSRKARGEGDSDAPPDRVASDFAGRFVMQGGVIRFSRLTFAVPGARLDLAGTYAVRSEVLDFRGTVRMQAKLSELTTGVKSFLLKAVDPLMRRKDVTVIPINVSGTAEKPEFGLDIKRAIGAR
jgi:hypothetical protein